MFDYADYIARFEKLQGSQGFRKHCVNPHEGCGAADRSCATGKQDAKGAPEIHASTYLPAAPSTRGKAVLASIVTIALISALFVTMAAHSAIAMHRG